MAIVHLAIHDAVALKQNPGAAYLNKKGIVHGIALPLAGNLEDIIAGAAVTTLKGSTRASMHSSTIRSKA